mmetsp:Transcript_44010/g.127285  ORF Transcript_44010/g.127285 Transcript_44010/m.127285 type:complete len:230 (-) Transcript_44010:1615-2304(-)
MRTCRALMALLPLPPNMPQSRSPGYAVVGRLCRPPCQSRAWITSTALSLHRLQGQGPRRHSEGNWQRHWPMPLMPIRALRSRAWTAQGQLWPHAAAQLPLALRAAEVKWASAQPTCLLQARVKEVEEGPEHKQLLRRRLWIVMGKQSLRRSAHHRTTPYCTMTMRRSPKIMRWLECWMKRNSMMTVHKSQRLVSRWKTCSGTKHSPLPALLLPPRPYAHLHLQKPGKFM